MDAEAAIIAMFYNRLTSSVALQGLFEDTPRVHLVLPDEEAPTLPYITHRTALGTPPDAVIQTGTYYLDLWDNADTAERILEMRGAIVGLFDLMHQTPPGSSVRGVRLSLEASGFVPTDETDLWHYAMAFHIRFGRAQDLTAILSR